MAGAAGGFVTRAFESMLKECSAKKLTSLQSAIQSYLGWYNLIFLISFVGFLLIFHYFFSFVCNGDDF